MEILRHVGREMPPDTLEWNTIRNRGPVVSEPYVGYDMECSKNPWDGSPPHTVRNEKGPRRSNKGRNGERKILVDAIARYSGPPTHGDQDRCLLHSGTQTYVRRVWPYFTRAKLRTENQYTSLRITINETIHHQDWKVEQIRFITDTRSVNSQVLIKILKFFQVPKISVHIFETDNESIRRIREYSQIHV
jgi:hypothetical protein